MDLDRLVADVLPTVVDIRRRLHRTPELSGAEYHTTESLAETLRAAGLRPRVRTPKTGLVVDVGTPGPTVLFRADLDALPIQEPPGLPFASEHAGVMHACGHDAHAAVAVGVALAAARLDDLPGRIRVVFQPAEETFPGGAYELIREGVLDGVSAALAFHVDPGLEPGTVGLRSGPIASAADRFFVTLEGPGGHTARPHTTVDLVYAAGLLVSQLPGLVDRLTDARSPLVVTFGRIHGGTADNVIPTQVELSGTVRTPDRDLWDEIPGLFETLVTELVHPIGAKALVHYQRGIPPVVNHPGVVDQVERTVMRVLGPEAAVSADLSMGAEDFARYLEAVPGALLRLGCRPDGRPGDLHSATFLLDESCLEVGVQVGLAACLDLLAAHRQAA